MNCRSARRAIFEAGLEPLTQDRAADLERHLSDCGACDTARQVENGWLADLASLRQAAAPSVDLRLRVMKQLRPTLAGPRCEVSNRQLAWASVSALALLALAVGWAARILPGLPALARETLVGGASLLAVVRELGRPLDSLWNVVRSLAAAMTDVAPTLLGGVQGLADLAVAGTAAAYVAMAVMIVTVIGRDLRRRAPAIAHKESAT